jgi:HSP20 family molecular chaperone IbpA
MSDEFDDDDEYDEFIDKIKNKFNIDSDVFDAEFYIFPSSGLGKKFGLDPEDKGFKITYHYERGMDKPEIKIHGNFNKDKLEDYLKRMKFIGKNQPNFKKLFQSNIRNKKSQKIVDARELSLQEPQGNGEKKEITEPNVELIESGDMIELIIEAPGIKESDIFISLDDQNKVLRFSAENDQRRYNKSIQLPCKSSVLNDTLEINNGIVFFKCKKK